jgi:hypothetical protein
MPVGFARLGQHVDRQQVHGVHQEDPDEHGEGQRGDELARLGRMDDALGLVGDHFDDDLDGGLEAAGHAGSRAGGEAGHDEHGEQAEADGEEQGIEVDDRPVDQANLFLVGEEGEVVDDVFGCGGTGG